MKAQKVSLTMCAMVGMCMPVVATSAHADNKMMAMEKTPTAMAEESDSDALAFLLAVDENEVAAAQQAEKKGVSPKVMEFAKQMISEHSENAAKAKALASGMGVELSPSKVEKAKGVSELGMMMPLSGKTYEQSYVKGMVKGHTSALNALDETYSKSVKSEDVKKFVMDTRAHVAMHLAKAKSLEAME